MSNVEFVMEVDGSLSESGNNILMELEGSLDDDGDLLLDGGLEFLEVTVHEGIVNGEEGCLLGEGDSAMPEMSLISGVDIEGTSRGVHGSDRHGADDFDDGELANIIPMSIISMLSQEGNSSLGVVGIEHGHIEIVNEIDQFCLSSRTLLTATLLFEGLLEHTLEVTTFSIIIEVDDLVEEHIGLSLIDFLQETLQELSLTGSGHTDQQ